MTKVLKKQWSDRLAEYEYWIGNTDDEQIYYVASGDYDWAQRQAAHYGIPIPVEEEQND